MSTQLMRGKRNFTRTAVHAAPKPFLLVALNEAGSPRLTTHLVCCIQASYYVLLTLLQNDQISISHKHQNEDGLPNLEDLQDNALASDDGASTSSVVHTPPFALVKRKTQAISFSSEVGFAFLLKTHADEVRMLHN